MKRLAGLFLILILVTSALLQAAEGSKITPVLQERMQQVADEETIAVWVFFTDKGADWEQQLPLIEQRLLPHARARRLRNRPADQLVDFYDVPVNPQYLQQVRALATRFRHKSRWLNAASLEATPAQIRQIEALPFVEKITVVHRFRGPQVPEGRPVPPNQGSRNTTDHLLDYGASFTQNNLINVPALHDLGYDGSGVIICMLDAGFNNLQHEALVGINILQTWDFVNGDSIVWDQPGQMGHGDHGTLTLGTIAGYKPGSLIGPAFGASFLLAKTENTDYEQHIEEDHWVAGAEWADSLGADIISSSLGYRDFDPGQTSYTWQDMDGNTAIVTIGADRAASRGILVVNSAGNEGSSTPSNPNTLVAPADGDSVLAVGGVDGNGLRVYFSSMGPTADGRIKPDVMAQASQVVAPSSLHTSMYLLVDGTSFSCPLTAGSSALILQVNPHLSNMQIIAALKATADHASNPNNEYGWGVIDAYAAAFYYTPQISHTPLSDTEDLTGPYTVEATITSNFPLNSDSLWVFYRYGQGNFQQVALQPLGSNLYQAQIPGPGSETDVSYYIHAVNDSGIAANAPIHAPTELYTFHVGPDTVPPVIVHQPLSDVAHMKWPAVVPAHISDNLGVDESQLYVEWKKNGVAQNNFPLTHVQDDLYSGVFNEDTTQVHVGDVIEYRIHASDLASNPNTTYHPQSGYHQFTVVATRGFVLVIDDETPSRGSFEDRGQMVEYHPEQTTTSTQLISHYLNELGFLVTTESPTTTNPQTWSQYNLVISASGENPGPVANATYRQALIQHVQNGGKLLIEGGEVGYDAVSGVGYSDFAAQVLHVTDWQGDDEGPLQKITAQSQHPLVTTPNSLPSTIYLNYNSMLGWYDQDAMTPDMQSYLVYQPQSEPGTAGILIYDDNTNPLSAQIVYWAFDFSSIMDTTVAKNLLENSVVYLLTNENPVGLGHTSNALPRQVQLYPNYPNPFNPSTTIKFYLPSSEKIALEVYNNLGQRVAVLQQGRMEAGIHRLEWNARGIASGIYYVVLKAGDVQRVQKVILMK